MKLQITLKQNQKDEIRERYEDLCVFQLCTKVQETYIGTRTHICFADAEVFYNVMQMLDEILTNPQKYHASCKRLWDDTFQVFKQQCQNDQAEDVKYQTMLVFMAVNMLLLHTPEPVFRTTIADNIFRELWEKDENTVKEYHYQHCETISSLETDLTTWLEKYIQHNSLLSKEMEDIVDPPSKKKKKAVVSYCCFQYNCKDKLMFTAAMEGLYNTLIREHLIDASTTQRQIELLFGGRGTNENTIIWTGKKCILAFVVKIWMEHKVISCVPDGTTHWQIVEKHFVDVEGRSLTKLGSEKHRKKDKELVQEIADTLMGFL